MITQGFVEPGNKFGFSVREDCGWQSRSLESTGTLKAWAGMVAMEVVDIELFCPVSVHSRPAERNPAF